ncbi:hypothetical protein KFL_001600030 [Klebsormidium nitens]|uniref:Uncharacterized protein n=1 Tax=Klebsormidium nitens TaxID=105231 RepID=A0A1Y1HYL0_KLENI|nr:hypothetical protein KFL_001600030 [Klebsormidium nitens]|eukprot:GAQ83734.1 hypothetical protein KFL_001600030 [Klebsormidium nitens]
MGQENHIKAGEIVGKRQRTDESGTAAAPLYDPTTDSWTTPPTPEAAAAFAAKYKREPNFEGAGSRVRTDSNDEVDLKLSDDLWAVVSGHPGNAEGVLVTFRDGKTNRPVMSPEGVTLEVAVSGASTGIKVEPFFGVWPVETHVKSWKLSKRNGRTYFFECETAFNIREA